MQFEYNDPNEYDRRALAKKLIKAQDIFNKKLEQTHNKTRVIIEYRAHLYRIYKDVGLHDLKFGVLINAKHQLAIFAEDRISYWAILGIKSEIDKTYITVNLQFDEKNEA